MAQRLARGAQQLRRGLGADWRAVPIQGSLRARHGEGPARIAGAQHDVLSGVARQWRDPLGLRGLCLGVEAVVRQAGDVGAARADLHGSIARGAKHGTAGHGDCLDVEGTQVQAMAPDSRRPLTSPTIDDDRDVRARAPDLHEHTIRDAEMDDRRCHTRRRPREDRPYRPDRHLVRRHHPAIGAHDHQRRADAEGSDRRVRSLHGRHHLRENRAVDDGGPGPRPQAVEPRDLVRACGEKPHLATSLHRGELARGVIHRVSLRRDEHLRTLGSEFAC